MINYADILEENLNFAKSIQIRLDALKENNKNIKFIPIFYTALSNSFLMLNKLDKALNYSDLAIESINKNNFSYSANYQSYIIRMEIFLKQNKVKDADSLFHFAKPFLKHQNEEVYSYYNGILNLYKKNYKESEQIFLKLLKKIKHDSKYSLAAACYFRLGQLNENKLDYSNANYYFQKYYQVAYKAKSKLNKLEALNSILQLEKKWKNTKYLLNNFQRYELINLQKELNNNLSDAYFFTIEKHEKAEMLLYENKELEIGLIDAKIKVQNYLSLFLITALVTSFLLILIQVKRNKQLLNLKKIIEEQNQNLKLYYASLSHDLKSPLLHLKNDIHKIAHNNSFNNSLLIIDKAIGLTEKLIEIFDFDGLDINYYQIDFKEIIYDLQKNELSNPDLSIVLISYTDIKGDTLLIRTIIKNIFENVIKYSIEKPEVFIEYFDSKNYDIIQFKNLTSINSIQQITEAYIRGTNSTNISGKGLGLFIIKKIMLKHFGKLEVEILNDLDKNYFILRLFFPKLNK